MEFYIKKEFNEKTNILSITSFRNIIYILTDLEKKIGLTINDSFIKELKEFTLENLIKIAPKYIN
jgi:hypothetical protein